MSIKFQSQTNLHKNTRTVSDEVFKDKILWLILVPGQADLVSELGAWWLCGKFGSLHLQCRRFEPHSSRSGLQSAEVLGCPGPTRFLDAQGRANPKIFFFCEQENLHFPKTFLIFRNKFRFVSQNFWRPSFWSLTQIYRIFPKTFLIRLQKFLTTLF